MELTHTNGKRRGVFELKDGVEMVGEMTYVWTDDDCFLIDHTGVNNAYRGQRLGEQLVQGAVDYARRENLKIVPVCTYAKAKLERNPDYADVLKK